MREVILHIGIHKTGTTSIQAALQGYDDHGVRVASFAEQNHSIPIYTMFSAQRYDYHIWRNQGLTKDDIDKKMLDYFEILQSDLRDERVGRLIISGEGMRNLNEMEQGELCTYFKSRGFRVKILCVVRNPVDWATSANQQYAVGGAKTLRAVNPEYKKSLSGFMQEVHVDDITVLKYEDLLEKGLIKSISEIFEIKLKERQRLNESITREALLLTYEFNNISMPTLGTRVRALARRKVLWEFRRFFSIQAGFTKLCLDEFDILDDGVEEELQFLKSNFGLVYSFDRRSKRPTAEFNVTLENLKTTEFFSSQGYSCDNNGMLSDNLTQMFINTINDIPVDA